jgi:hypothetical protein
MKQCVCLKVLYDMMDLKVGTYISGSSFCRFLTFSYCEQSDISESHGLPRQPPLEMAISQSKNTVGRMLEEGLGAAAYCGLDQFLNCSLKPQ